MSLARAAVTRPVTTIASVLAIVLLGSVSLGRTPVSLLPDVQLPVLTIRTLYTGAAAEEVSRFIAEPVEEAIAATPGLVELRSVSRNGEATTTARFAWGTNMQTTLLNVRERLDNARSQLPERAERPTLLTSDPGERPIAVLSMSIAGDMRQLARTAEDVHARRLEQIAGVASVAVVGAPEDEVRIEVDPARMRALALTPNDVSLAIRAANVSGVGGTIRRGQFRFSVRTLTEFRTPDEIRDVPVGPAGSGITLKDLATVTTTVADPKTLTRFDSRPAVGLVVYKDAGANTVAVTGEIQRVAEQLRKEFPGIGLTIVAAQANFVVDALSNLGQEIVIGGILSLFVIVLFLRDWRMSLAIAMMIPLSVLLALVILQALDVTINVLSLGGLALGVGLLVDNAIVVAEAAVRKREEGRPLLEATIEATEEVSGPLIAGTLTTLLVFGPIIFVRGLAAALFRDLSLSVVTSVGASLVLALTLMPVMIVGRRREDERTRRRGRAAGGEGSEDSRLPPAFSGASFPVSRPPFLTRIGEKSEALYERGMRWALKNPWPVFGISAASIVLTVWVLGRIPREILPQVDEGMVVAALHLPEGTAIEATTQQVGRIEEAARTLGAKGIYSRVGVATDEEILAGAEPGSSATAQLLVPVPEGQRAAAFADKLRAAVPDLAAGALALDLAGQSEFGSLIGREGRLVRVEMSARTLDDAARWADTARARLQKLPSLADVRDPNGGTQPVVEVTLQRTLLAERGISVDAVANALAGGLGGVESSDFRETDRRTPISVRFAGLKNEDLAEAMATPVKGVPIAQLVKAEERQAPIEVVRVGQRPVAVVEGLIESGGTRNAAEDVRATMAALTLPSGITYEVSGADAEQERTTRELTLVGWLSVALVFLVLAGEFASFTVPLVVMLTVPLAAVGGILFLWITGQSLNAVALIGIVVMIGMADNEAVVKLDAIRRFREEGHSIEDAIMLGGHQRLRAIAMTSITTITGVLPLVFGWGSGGALYQPLAAGVIGGSVSALLVTFFLLPTAYAALERRREDGKTRRRGVAEGGDVRG
ncbi:MAG: efflux RND transporter permease subunit [Gemmatimonadaceae bacterium]|nr:efflux RND transporter permease subunit [Gemmatimonadaceae bacterium]